MTNRSIPGVALALCLVRLGANVAVANNQSDTVSVLLGLGVGVYGPATDYRVGSGPFSVAVGDLSGDGKLDLAVANTGSDTVSVLLNQGPWALLGSGLAGVSGVPSFTGAGTLQAGSVCALDLVSANPSAECALIVSLSSTPAAFKCGTLVPFPPLLSIPLVVSASGTVPLHFTWPTGIPASTTLWFQHAISDVAAIQKVSLSNAVMGTTP